MSRSVDERVVEMKFDNKNFEKNVSESLGTLEKLKSSLDFDKSQKNIASFQKSINEFDTTKLANDISKIADRFSVLGIMGDQVLRRLADSFVNVGLKAKGFIDSLTIDQVTAGWGKYIDKTTSIQTIMNATGASIDEVNSVLDKLQWFSDETSFSFTDMAAALGQMTSAGGDMKKLVPMIMGIANATAYAGKGPAEFSRAIYNLNQSYGTGALKYMDWKSLEMAGVNSKQLKQTLIDTAVELGRIKKGQIDLSNFNESLKDDWADQSVMEKAFGKFAQVTEEAYKMVNDSASGIDTASEAYDKLAGKYDEIYYRAARAAQEAKTFDEVIGATKDAVSSGWMKTFELIFGNYEEAKELWTDMANSFWELFAQGAESRNELLSEWHVAEVGGYEDFKEAIGNILSALTEGKEVLSQIVYDILPDIDTPHLTNAVTKFKEFSENLKIFLTGKSPIDLGEIMEEYGLESKKAAIEFIKQDESLSKLSERYEKIIQNGAKFREGFAGIVSFVNTLRKGLITIWNTISPFGKVIKSIFGFVNNIFASLGRVFQYIDQSINASEGLRKVIDRIATAISGALDTAGRAIYDFFSKTFKFNEVTERFEFVSETIDKIRGKSQALGKIKIGNNFRKFYQGISDVFSIIADGVKWVWKQIPKLLPYIVGAISKIVEWISILGAKVGELFTNIKTWFYSNDIPGHIVEIYETIKKYLTPIFDKIKGFFQDLTKGDVEGTINGIFEFAKQGFESLKPVIQPVIDLLKQFWDLITAGNFEGFKNLMKGLAAGGGLYGIISVSKSGKGLLDSFTGVGEAVSGLLGRFSGEKSTAKTMLEIAIAIGILALSLSKLSKLSVDNIVNATFALGTMLFMLSGFLKVLKKLSGGALFKVSGEYAAKDSILTKIFGDRKSIFFNPTPIQQATKALIKLGTAMVIFSIAMKVLSTINSDGITNSLIAIGGILALFAGFSAIMSNISKTANIAGKKASSFGKNMALFGVGMLLIVNSLLLLAGAIALINLFEWDEIVKAGEVIGQFALLVSVLAFVGSQCERGIRAFGTALLVGAAAMVIAIPALLTISSVIQQLSVIPEDALLRTVLGIGAALAILAAATRISDWKGSAGLVLAAGGLYVFGLAISALGELFTPVTGKSIVKALLILAGGFAVLAGGIALLKAAGFGYILDTFSRFMKKTASSVLILAGALALLAIIGPKTLKTLLDGISDLGPSFENAIASIIEAIINAVMLTGPKVILSLGQLLWMVVEWVGENAYPLTKAIVQVLTDILKALNDSIMAPGGFVEQLVVLIVKLIDSVANAILNNSDTIVDALMAVVDACISILIDFAAELAARIPGLGEPIRDALYELKDEILGTNSKYGTSGTSTYDNAGEKAKTSAAYGKELDKIVKGLSSEDIEEQAKALKAYEDVLSWASENKGQLMTVSSDPFYSSKLKALEKYGFSLDIGPKIGSEEDYDIGQGILDYLRQPEILGAVATARKEVTNYLDNEVEETTEDVAETASKGAKKINIESAKSFLSSIGIPLNSIDAGSAMKIQGMLDAGLHEETIASFISGNVTDKFQLDEEKLREFGFESDRFMSEGLLSGLGGLLGTGEYVSAETLESLEVDEEEAKEVGKNYIKGLAKGIREREWEAIEAADSVSQNVVKRTKNVMQIQSPSRVGQEIGKFWDLGIALGLKDYAYQVASASSRTANELIWAFSNAAGTASELITNGLDDPSNLTPVMSLENTRAMSHLASVMDNQNRRISTIGSQTNKSSDSTAPNYNTKNYGGFTINLQTQSDNPSELARQIMEEIQIEIDRKEAALA